MTKFKRSISEIQTGIAKIYISNEVSETAIEEVASSVRLALHDNHQIKIINEYLYM